ncbi:MAG: DUF4139 domain-containing protein [Saprospiraceae bacterium]
MKLFKTMLCLLVISLPMSIMAQIQEKIVKTDIDEVKVYLQGAEIIRTEKFNLSKGKHRIIFSELSPRLDARSIQVTASNNTSILSTTSKTNFMSPRKPSARAQVIKDSIELLTMGKQDLYDIKRAYQKEEEIIQKNQNLKSATAGITTEELIKVTKFYRERFREIYKAVTQLDRKINKMNKEVNVLNRQLSQMNSGNDPTSEIYLELNVKSAQTTELKVRYIVTSAGWSPVYDLKAGKLNEPINLKYRALAYNNTGIDWEDVKVTLSTADPYQSATKPFLSPWRLNTFVLSNRVAFQQSQGRLNQGQLQNNTLRNGNDMNISEDMASVPRPTRAGDVSGIQMEQIEISELSNDFPIEDPYTLPADSKPYSIDIKTHVLNASYRHFAVPKLDKDAFLLAQIIGWESLDLIDGPMNIYHGDSYIGQAKLDTRTLNDTLDLSLGRDKNVVITRVKQKELNKKQFFGSDRKVTRSYKMTVKNNHNQPINLEIQDQLPISNDKEIVVNLVNKSKAEYEKVTGKLVWHLKKIPSGSKKSVEFTYTIKHPKSKPVQLERKKTQWVPRY